MVSALYLNTAPIFNASGIPAGKASVRSAMQMHHTTATSHTAVPAVDPPEI